MWRQACVYWKRHRTAKALFTWQSRVCESVKLRNRLRRAVQSMQKRKLAEAFRGWYLFIDRQVKCCLLVLRILAKASKRQLHSGWRSWCTFVIADRTTQRLESDRMKFEKIRSKRLLLTFRRATNRSLYLGFRTWLVAIVESRRLQTAATRVFFRLRKFSLWQAFLKWQSNAQDQKRLRCILHKSLARFRLQSIAKVWQGWNEKLRRRVNAKKILRHILHEKQRENRRKLVYWGFHVWNGYTVSLKLNDLDVLARNAIVEKRNTIIRNVINKFLKANLQNAWRSWSVTTREIRLGQQRIQRGISHWLRTGLARAFRHWRLKIASEIRDRSLVKKYVMRMHRALLSRSFCRWGCGINSFVSKRRKLRLRLRQILAKWKRLYMGKGFVTWILWLKEEKHRIAMLRKIASLDHEKNQLLGEATFHQEKLKARVRAFALRGIFWKYNIEAKKMWQKETTAEIISRWRLFVMDCKQNRDKLESTRRLEIAEQRHSKTISILQAAEAEKEKERSFQRILAMRTVNLAGHARVAKRRRQLRRTLHAWRLQCGRELKSKEAYRTEEIIANLRNTIASESNRSRVLQDLLEEHKQELLQKNDAIDNSTKEIRVERDLRNRLEEAYREMRQQIQENKTEQIQMNELVIEHANSFDNLKREMEIAKEEHKQALAEKEELHIKMLLDQKVALESNHAEIVRQKELAHESSIKLMQSREQASLEAKVHELKGQARRKLAMRTLSFAKHAISSRERRLIRRCFHAWLNEWHHPTIKEKLLKSHEEMILVRKESETRMKLILEEKNNELLKFQKSLLFISKHEDKYMDSKPKAIHEDMSDYEKEIALKFEEGEAFYISGKTMKDKSLLLKSQGIFDEIDIALEGRFQSMNKAEQSGSQAKSISMKLLHGRAIAWKAMICSTLDQFKEAIILGERSAAIFDTLNDMRREFGTLYNMFEPIMRVYCKSTERQIETSDDAQDTSKPGAKNSQKDAKIQLLQKALEHCNRMQFLVDSQDVDHAVYSVASSRSSDNSSNEQKHNSNQSDKAVRFGSPNQLDNLTWRIKHLHRVISGEETATWISENSELVFKSAKGVSQRIHLKRAPSLIAANIDSRKSSISSSSSESAAGRRSYVSSGNNFGLHNRRGRRESEIYTTSFSVEKESRVDEAEWKRRSYGLDKRRSLANITSSHMKHLDIASAPRDVRSAAQGVLTAFKTAKQSEDKRPTNEGDLVNRQNLVKTVMNSENITLVGVLPGGRTLLRKLKEGDTTDIARDEFVDMIQTAALQPDETRDRITDNSSSGTNVKARMPFDQTNRTRKAPRSRRKSLLALASMGLARSRVRAISREAIVQEAVNRQEVRKNSRDRSDTITITDPSNLNGAKLGARKDSTISELEIFDGAEEHVIL